MQNTKTQESKKSKKAMSHKDIKKAAAAKGEGEDIIEIILEDHMPLKELIQVMKDEDSDFSDLEPAFFEFAPLLLLHAKSEDKSLYEFMKAEGDFRKESFEGKTEHDIAEHLVNEIQAIEDEDEWCAKVKVLAELVEHHIEEEEEEFFPDLKKQVEKAKLIELGKEYLSFKAQLEDEDMSEVEDVEPKSKSQSTGARH